MNKPLTLSVEELEQQIANTINEAQLPLFCVRVALQDLLKQVVETESKEIANYEKTQNDGIIDVENNTEEKENDK